MTEPLTSKAAIILWNLITVTQGGAVNHSDGFKSRYMCEEAKSVAQYGETIEELREIKARRQKDRDEAKAKWLAEHPGRGPKNESERKAVKENKPGWILGETDMTGLSPNPAGWFNVPELKDDGLIYDRPPDVWSNSYRDSNFKFAECIPDADSVMKEISK